MEIESGEKRDKDVNKSEQRNGEAGRKSEGVKAVSPVGIGI